jgi:hypothetical protein
MLELIVADGGSNRRGERCVSVSGKLHRILIHKEAYAEMKLRYGEDFEYVQFWIDSERPERFWMKPSTREAAGTSRIALNRQNGTRTISAVHVLRALGWKSEDSVRCPLEWDSENEAAVVDTSPSRT